MMRKALVVGINNYPYLGNLKTPASDAEQIASLLGNHGGFQVERLPVKEKEEQLCVDENPSPQQLVTSTKLKQALAELFKPHGSDVPDTALFYFAGHGLRSDEGITEGFLATSNARPDKDVWGVSLSWLKQLLLSSPVKQQIIWLDCCYSGQLLNGKFINLQEANPGERGQGRDLSFIAACGDASVAYGNAEHGILTRLLLKGLDPHICVVGQWINNHDLAAFISKQLEIDEKLRTFPQHPLHNNLGAEIKLIQGVKLSKYSDDEYQLHIILHWLIQLLVDNTIESIQVNSTAIPGKNLSVTADNVFVLYKDGHSCSIPTQKFEDWETQNQLDLERLVPQAKLAILILKEWYIKKNSTHLRDTKYKITRSDLLTELTKQGLSPTPKRAETEILATFRKASSIGRQWLRTIDGKPIPRSELLKIIKLIEQKSRTILLTDRPGTGKTCLLLELADYIEREKESVWGLLFIKGDQFTNLEKEQDLVAKGLPEDIVGQCARLADFRRVIIIIDSLDVLSLSRQHDSLKVFLGIIDRLEKLDGVTIITACRNFDLQYDPLLRGRSWQHRVNLQPLDFDNEVKPFLIDWSVDIAKITPELQALLQIPQNLRIYERLAKLGVQFQPASAYELYNSFIEEVVIKNPILGNEAVVALQNMAEQLMQQRSQSYSKVSFKASEENIRLLISQEVLLENSPGILAFSHQTLADCITVRAALAKDQTLAQFILEHPQLPFIRPAVRAFFFYLRAYQPDIFRRQVWGVVSHNEIAYHVKRLICESFSEIYPVDKDWRLLRQIFHNYPDLFLRLLWRANNGSWWNILTQHWLPEAKLLQDRENWLLQFVHWLGVWMNSYPVEVVAFWREAIAQKWAKPENLARSICSILTNFQKWDATGVQELLETLVEDFEIEKHDSLGDLLSRWIQATNTGDKLLWRYITKNVLLEDVRGFDLANKLRCMPHDFHEDQFLKKRLFQSDMLLNLVLNELEAWSAVSATRYGKDGLHNEFLNSTSWQIKHSKCEILPCRDLNILLDSVEKAIKHRVRRNDTWWLRNQSRLRKSTELAIRYFAIEAYKENINYSYSIKFWILILDIDCLAGTLFFNQFFNSYISGLERLLIDEENLRHSDLIYEIGELMKMAYPNISELVQLINQSMILSLISGMRKDEKKYSFWIYRNLYDLCISIPSIFRSFQIQEFVESCKNYFDYSHPEPKIHVWGGMVIPPLSSQDLLKLSDKGLFQLLRYYEVHQNRDIFGRDMIGGFSEVIRVLRDASSLHPECFIRLFTGFIQENLHQDYVCALVEGIAYHLEYRFGNARPGKEWKPVQPLLEGEAIASILLNWLERYFIIWEDGSTVSRALEACCDVLIDSESAERLSLLLSWLYSKYPDDRQIRENSNDLVSTAINSIHGVTSKSAIKLCNKLLEKEQSIPEMLLLLLRQTSRDKAIYVRVSVLRHLDFLIYKNPDFGWQLLADIFKEPQPRLWKYTELCFYYQYHNNFDRVSPYLNRLLQEGMEEAGDIWGRLFALASLAGHITQEELFETLAKINCNNAWRGATQVFTANLDLQEHTAKGLSGLITILRHENLSEEMIWEIDKCFKEETKRTVITREFAFTFLKALSASARNIDFDDFLEWLGYESRRNPLFVLELIELLGEKFDTTLNPGLVWRTEPLIAALNEILREADESDDLQLIQRAINVQDRFLRLNIRGMEELLNKAGQH